MTEYNTHKFVKYNRIAKCKCCNRNMWVNDEDFCLNCTKSIDRRMDIEKRRALKRLQISNPEE